ncbi:MAG: abortive infection family protein [Dehalococcoidales bacterium]|nr:abortive infection family protein [Dehalococcoidales bacterium]
MASQRELSEKVEKLKNLLVSYATGGSSGADEDRVYKELRTELLAKPDLKDQLPRFVRTCRDLRQFWEFIKGKFSTYRERRSFLWGEFNPIIDMLENSHVSPSDEGITGNVERVDSDTITEYWRKALDRRFDDPEGAITAARSLIESVCKHILDEARIEYENGAPLPKLYRLTAEKLNIAPSQQVEHILRQIFGGVTTVVEGLGALRNEIGDAHGGGKDSIRPGVHYAELAVNLAGAVAGFLITTWEQRTKDT